MLKRLCQAGLFVVVILSAFLRSSPAAAEKQKEKSEQVLQHPVLRAHFRERYLARNLRESRTRPSRLAMNIVDKQIGHFIDGVEGHLGHLSDSVEKLALSRRQIVGSQKSESAGREEMRQLASNISEHSEKLRKKIHVVLNNLRATDEFTPRINHSQQNGFYAAETAYLERQVEEAERLIQNYFFSSSPTVHVGDLRQHNMLMLLYRIREMARALERQISQHP